MILMEFGQGRRRAVGYQAVMREAGLEPRLVIEQASSPEAGVRAMQALLADGDNRIRSLVIAAAASTLSMIM